MLTDWEPTLVLADGLYQLIALVIFAAVSILGQLAQKRRQKQAQASHEDVVSEDLYLPDPARPPVQPAAPPLAKPVQRPPDFIQTAAAPPIRPPKIATRQRSRPSATEGATTRPPDATASREWGVPSTRPGRFRVAGLASATDIRRAIVLSEILALPVALRRPGLELPAAGGIRPRS